MAANALTKSGRLLDEYHIRYENNMVVDTVEYEVVN